MLHPATKCEFETRVKAVNWTLRKLARESGVDPMTAYRGAKTLRTNEALAKRLIEEELRIRDHLVALHGLPESGAQ